ncbi:DNA-binding protein [Roseomonas sp. KE0001]|uniref:DNA-binding protein n=1 Tax=Roseomonas sp. KE0001 TaxID=2479201 RepID=UPI0018E0296E|nr:DNA-binding protein [Roseomonas sp. KE0001]MBI0435425.1 hypothetical protein [Roseomonas sp. KE0001]
MTELPKFRENYYRQEATLYLYQKHGLKVAVGTLAKLVTTGGGPRYFKMGRSPLYPKQELDRWALEKLGKLRTSSSDAG